MKAKLTAILCASLFIMNCNDSAIVNSPGGPSELSSNRQKPDKVVFINSHEIALEKGREIPKGTFILKPGESREEYGASGPYDFSGLAKSAAYGARTVSVGPGFSEYRNIYLIAGSSSGISCPSGDKVLLDLNRGAGGKWVYLCASPYDGGRIQPSSIRTVAKSSYSPPSSANTGFNGVGGSNSDMNQGAGGKYVHGYYGTWSGSCAVDGIGAIFWDHWWEWPVSIPGGWREPSTTADLNDGAGGSWIYFIFRTGASNCWG